MYLVDIINARLKTIPSLPVKLDKRHVLKVCCSIPQTQNKREIGPHSATELKADSAFLQRIRQRVALQVPELGVIPCVPGQKSNWQLGEQENKNNIKKRIKVANYTLTDQSNGLFICGLFFLENGDSRVSESFTAAMLVKQDYSDPFRAVGHSGIVGNITRIYSHRADIHVNLEI